MFLERLFQAEGSLFLSPSGKENLQHDVQTYVSCMWLTQDLDSSYYSDYVKTLLKKRSPNCRSASDVLSN